MTRDGADSDRETRLHEDQESASLDSPASDDLADAATLGFTTGDGRSKGSAPMGQSGPPASGPPQARQPSRPLPRDTEHLTGRRLLNQYVIGERIGSGGFGSVYRAIDELKCTKSESGAIAIKVMDAVLLGDRLGALTQEVSRSHRVTHPNVLRVFAIHVDSDLAFITMELLEGETLAHRLARASGSSDGLTSLPVDEVDAIARQICEALEHCHAQQLVHADIKPDNVFLCSDGTVKLLDLGISQLMGSRDTVAGYSPLYASPQQIAGEVADPRDDLFSLGGLLYLCLTGRTAFAGQRSVDARTAGFEVDLSLVPRRYRRVLADALDYERASRIESADRLWRRISPENRRRRALFAGLVAASIALAVLANLLGQSAGKETVAVSAADRASAEALYAAATTDMTTQPGKARETLLQALVKNPYHEKAAVAFAEIIASTPYTQPTAFSMAWTDFAKALEAAPTSDALRTLARDEADRLLEFDPSGLSRSRVLSEVRAPLCVLPAAGYRSTELEAKKADLSIRC